MAGELFVPNVPSSYTVVGTEVWNFLGQVWQTTTNTFVTYNTANIANYLVSMTLQGTASGMWVGDAPVALPAGVYQLVALGRASGTIVETDAVVGFDPAWQWAGSAVQSLYAVPTLLLDLADGVETSYTLRQALRVILSCMGSVTGAPATPVFFAPDVVTPRVSVTANSSGNRTSTYSP